MFRIHLDQLYTHVLYKSISEQHNQFDEKLYTVAKNKCNTKWLTINRNKATGMHLSSPLTSSAAECMSCPSWNVKSWTKIPEFYRRCLLTSVLALQKIRQYIIASHQ